MVSWKKYIIAIFFNFPVLFVVLDRGSYIYFPVNFVTLIIYTLLYYLTNSGDICQGGEGLSLSICC